MRRPSVFNGRTLWRDELSVGPALRRWTRRGRLGEPSPPCYLGIGRTHPPTIAEGLVVVQFAISR